MRSLSTSSELNAENLREEVNRTYKAVRRMVSVCSSRGTPLAWVAWCETIKGPVADRIHRDRVTYFKMSLLSAYAP